MAKPKHDQQTRDRGLRFVKKLSDERKRVGISQSDLSLRTGISVDTIRGIENGRNLSLGVFIAGTLVHALGGSLDQWVREATAEPQREFPTKNETHNEARTYSV